MIPMGTYGRTRSRAYMTFFIIVINIVFFVIELIFISQSNWRTLNEWIFNPCHIGQVPITELLLDNIRSMFMHGGWGHLFGNMAFLWIFAPRVEEYFGSKRFLLFYLLAGTGAHLVFTVFSGSACTPVVGASGAISGVLAAFLILYPGVRVQAAIIPLFRAFRLPSLYYIGFWFVLQLFYGLLSLGPGGWAFGGVAYWGHLGGFAAGLILVFIATLLKPPPPVDPFGHLDD